MDKKLINLLLFIDFKKAFDLVNPNLLFTKLLNYGLQNSAIKLMSNYFDKRMQAVKIGLVRSEPVMINLGVPQGSILGPLLFLVYINDLPFYLNEISTKLFADDTTLHFSHYDVETIVSLCRKGISLMLDWCRFNYHYYTFLIYIKDDNNKIIKSDIANFKIKVLKGDEKVKDNN